MKHLFWKYCDFLTENSSECMYVSMDVLIRLFSLPSGCVFTITFHCNYALWKLCVLLWKQ